jgi:hypothetical protein
MGKGLLAWWRRRIVARGLAGAALLAVPVAVAAAIGFGTSLSGVAGGLSAVTNGPDAIPASQTTPGNLNRAVVALAGKPGATLSGNPGGSSGPQVSSPSTSGGTVGGSNTTSGSTGGGSGGVTGPLGGTGAPGINLPGGGGGGAGGGGQDAVNNIGSGVNNALGGLDNGLNGLLGH